MGAIGARTITTCRLLLMFVVSGAAAANIAVPGALTHVADVQPGETASGSVSVINATNEVQRVAVRIVDRIPAPQRQFVEAGSLDRSAALMIVPETREIVLAPQERREIAFDIVAPPGDAIAPGSYWATLLLEPENDLAGDDDEEDRDGASIVSRMRIAYGIIVHVNDPPFGAISIDDVRMGEPAAGSPSNGSLLQAAFSVEGQRVVDADAQLQVFDRETGVQVVASQPQRLRLYPGYPDVAAFELGELPPGSYEVLVVAENERDDLFAVRLDLDVGAETPN